MNNMKYLLFVYIYNTNLHLHGIKRTYLLQAHTGGCVAPPGLKSTSLFFPRRQIKVNTVFNKKNLFLYLNDNVLIALKSFFFLISFILKIVKDFKLISM